MNTKISQHIYGWLLVMPAVILMGTFTHLPSVTTLISSFFSNETKKRPSIFIGAENYEYMFEDPVFVVIRLSWGKPVVEGKIQYKSIIQLLSCAIAAIIVRSDHYYDSTTQCCAV